MLLMYIIYTVSTSVGSIPFNDIYHKLAKMTLCSILNVNKYHSKVIEGSSAATTMKHLENIFMNTCIVKKNSVIAI